MRAARIKQIFIRTAGARQQREQRFHSKARLKFHALPCFAFSLERDAPVQTNKQKFLSRRISGLTVFLFFLYFSLPHGESFVFSDNNLFRDFYENIFKIFHDIEK